MGADREKNSHAVRDGPKSRRAIVSIDGLELKEFDYIDIAAILDTSGAAAHPH
jgi:hypothetical protein